jgi:hypothetical protein
MLHCLSQRFDGEAPDVLVDEGHGRAFVARGDVPQDPSDGSLARRSFQV